MSRSRLVPALPNLPNPTRQLDRVPTVTFESGDDKFYSLLLLDPDFPSIQTPTDRSVVVAMVINIPGPSKAPPPLHSA